MTLLFTLERHHVSTQVLSLVPYKPRGVASAVRDRCVLMQLWQLLSQMHEDIDSQLPPSTWLAALLPPLVVHENALIASTPSLGSFERSRFSQDSPAQPHMYSPEAASIGSPCTGTGFSGQGETPGVLEQHQNPQAQCSFPDEFYPMGLDRESADAVAKLVLEVCCRPQLHTHT